jgi:cephalosporin hydroxylase
MAKSILTASQITKEALSVLEEEMYNSTPYCLVQVTLKDGTTQEIIIKIRPSVIHEIGTELKGGRALTLDNGESAILVMADQIKHITIMKVTKEQS